MKYLLRLAEHSDSESITTLIKLSARKLGVEFYQPEIIESALKGAFGVDTQLIKDRTYYVIEDNKNLIACGGWSFRKTLFGSDSNNSRDSAKLNPETEAAKIRAFFIHPDYARLGLGKTLLNTCEQQVQQAGFRETQLMSTLSGIKFYEKNGYIGKKFTMHKMNDGTDIKFFPMNKVLSKRINTD